MYQENDFNSVIWQFRVNQPLYIRESINVYDVVHA